MRDCNDVDGTALFPCPCNGFAGLWWLQGPAYFPDSCGPAGLDALVVCGQLDADSGGNDRGQTPAFGEGLIGQCGAQAQIILIRDLPEGVGYIHSGLA